MNAVLYLSRLTKAHDVKTSYVTALGNFFSQAFYCIETDEMGERYFHYWHNDVAVKFLFGQNDSPEFVDKIYPYDVVYLSGITLVIFTEEGKTQLFAFRERFTAQGGKIMFSRGLTV